MKRYLLILLSLFMLCGCSSDDEISAAYEQGYNDGYAAFELEFEKEYDESDFLANVEYDTETNLNILETENTIDEFEEYVEKIGLPVLFDVNFNNTPTYETIYYDYTAEWQENTIGNSYILRTSFYFIDVYNENNNHYLFIDTHVGPVIITLSEEQYLYVINDKNYDEYFITLTINDVTPIHYNFYADPINNGFEDYSATIETETNLILFKATCISIEKL